MSSDLSTNLSQVDQTPIEQALIALAELNGLASFCERLPVDKQSIQPLLLPFDSSRLMLQTQYRSTHT